MPDAADQPAARAVDTHLADWRLDTELADWRLGTVAKWDAGLLARVLISLGAALALGAVVHLAWRSPLAAASASLIVVTGMLIPAVAALRRARPAPLLRVRALDLLYGVTLGAMLRLAQGWLEVATGGSAALPAVPGRVEQPQVTLLLAVALTAVAAPVVTELLRAVLLVALYSLLRLRMSAVAAGAVAVIATTAVLVLVPAAGLGATGEQVRVDTLVAAGMLGLVCGMLVMLTGRVWGAVLVHVVYGASFVALALAGLA